MFACRIRVCVRICPHLQQVSQIMMPPRATSYTVEKSTAWQWSWRAVEHQGSAWRLGSTDCLTVFTFGFCSQPGQGSAAAGSGLRARLCSRLSLPGLPAAPLLICPTPLSASLNISKPSCWPDALELHHIHILDLHICVGMYECCIHAYVGLTRVGYSTRRRPRATWSMSHACGPETSTSLATTIAVL